MCRKIMLTCSETCSTLARPSTVRVLDLLPSSYHDSMPGSSALKPLRRKRLTCGSESSDWLLSEPHVDRKSTRLNSSHRTNSYAVSRLKKQHGLTLHKRTNFIHI